MKNYENYERISGLLREKDYEKAFSKVGGKSTRVEGLLMRQAKSIADFAGIETCEATLRLYAVLREDVREPHFGYNYSQMCDQQLFAESLLMSGDILSFERMKEAYSNISF